MIHIHTTWRFLSPVAAVVVGLTLSSLQARADFIGTVTNVAGQVGGDLVKGAGNLVSEASNRFESPRVLDCCKVCCNVDLRNAVIGGNLSVRNNAPTDENRAEWLNKISVASIITPGLKLDGNASFKIDVKASRTRKYESIIRVDSFR